MLERAVTSRRPGTPAAERKRQQRERDRGLVYQREDWQLFLDPSTLSQKAGCQPEDLRCIVLREIVDNALDAGADAVLHHISDTWVVVDNGPGLDPADVPRLFSVNRPLISSKLRRLPLRGMLGNGLRVVMGAVAASGGWIVVETRGHRITLAVDMATGMTIVASDKAAPVTAGMIVSLRFGPDLRSHGMEGGGLARDAISIAGFGKRYNGPSSPWWYGPRDLHQLMQQVMRADTTVARVCRDLGLTLEDDLPARELSRDDALTVLNGLRERSNPVPPERLGMIGGRSVRRSLLCNRARHYEAAERR
jgi:Histidine kinase-, DNA gyrase B-, and HSP90-like ATPase